MFLTNIGSYAQFLRAETHFSLGARMMVETPEYLLPHAPHELPLNKTPLQYWLIGMAYKLFGFNHGAGRIPSALCGLGIIMAVYVLGIRFHGKIAALTASAMLTTTYLFWSFARLSMPDLLLTLCIAITMVCWTPCAHGQDQPSSDTYSDRIWCRRVGISGEGTRGHCFVRSSDMFGNHHLPRFDHYQKTETRFRAS